MEVYADNLICSLRELDQDRFTFTEYRPKLSAMIRGLPETANLRMRAARYVDYPSQAKQQQSDLYHILDHGYAHLMRQLDPARTIVTVHDIIPILAGREWIKGVQPSRRNWLADWTARFY